MKIIDTVKNQDAYWEGFKGRINEIDCREDYWKGYIAGHKANTVEKLVDMASKEIPRAGDFDWDEKMTCRSIYNALEESKECEDFPFK